MAIYHLAVKPVSRSAGRSATASAAYRAGVEITDERTGEIHDYRRKRGVESADIVLPDGAPEWATDRAELWNAAELAEKRKDACVAREFEVALPAELSPSERRRLALDFAKEMANREGCAVDVAIHAPGKDGDNRNHHAHILRTTRKVEAEGLGEKLDTEKAGRKRADDLAAVRARWADLTNERLRENGIEARIDHRSHAERGIEAEPTQHLGPAATGYERRTGQPSENRKQHERDAIERLAGVQELSEQARSQDRSILDLSMIIEAAHQVRAEQQAEQRAEQQARDREAREREQQVERQRIDRMSAAELRAEIDRVRPPPVRDLVARDPAVIEAERQHQAAQEQGRQAQARELQAQREAANWRQAHPVRAKMHDAGLISAGFLVERDQEREQARSDWLKAAPRIEDTSQRAGQARTEAEARVTLDTAPARAKADELEKIAQQKEHQEKAQALELERRQRAARDAQYERESVARKFVALAVKRDVRAGGWSDSGSQWQATPPGLRAAIEQYNAVPRDQRAAALERLLSKPQQLDQLRDMLDQRRGRGMKLGG